ncbi:MAG: hypothetical protein IJI68_09070 [Eggerthellaceae bacterium]|jgi:triacylglycerol lipase|nr:hypothetical protein [Eggerthellaceae bacterium]
MEHIAYIFCHGLNGSGQYDEDYAKKPYWGGASGDVVAKLRERGYDAYAASVAPQGSAWDRACELYAQIAGTTTDYGLVHSQEYRHDRFGVDFTGRSLIPSWDENTRLVLVGHSFGGVTIRLLGELLANGSEEERAATPEEELSPLFRGGMADRIRAIVTIAAPTNGTTAYDMAHDSSFDVKRVKIPFKYTMFDRLMKSRTKIEGDGRDARDWANYDMLLDNAQALNARISLLPHVYYLSVACNATIPGKNGTRVPDPAYMEPLFVKTSTLMGCYTGKTKAGQVVDDEWYANDGLVNTISARAPFGDPRKPLDRDNIEKGVWNIMPDKYVNHSYFQGGYFLKQDPFPFFRDLMELLSSLD